MEKQISKKKEKEGDNGVADKLVDKKRDRPLLLGELDKQIQSYLEFRQNSTSC